MKRVQKTIPKSVAFAVVLGLMAPGFLLRTHAGSGPGTIVDSLGRQVYLAETPGKIACMYAFTGHVVAMLGRADDIVAVSNGLKRDVLLREMYPAIGDARVPRTQGATNIEELARAGPAIVFVDGMTGRNPVETARLDAVGLVWLAFDFNGIVEQQQAITAIGQAVGAPERAASYNAYYQSCIARVTRSISAMPVEDRIRLYHAVNEPTRTALPNSLSAEWIDVAGAVNVASQEPAGMLDGKHRVSIEQILLWNPEVILANEPGVARLIAGHPKWSNITAVKTGRVHQMPIGISRWGHPGSLETPLALLWVGKTIYPERFVDLDIAHETKEFYRTFFNHSLSDDMARKILQGKGMRLAKDRRNKQR